MSVFILRFSFHNSPLSLCFTSIAELCGSLEFRPALSHTVGAGLPPPFGPRRFFRRDRNTNTGIVKFRVVITPAVVILLRDFSGFQLSGLLLPGTNYPEFFFPTNSTLSSTDFLTSKNHPKKTRENSYAVSLLFDFSG